MRHGNNLTSRIFALTVLIVSALSLSGCVGLVVGTAAGSTAAAFTKEKSLSDQTSDARIEVDISALWFQHSVDMYNDLSVTATEGRVLLTGVVPKAEWRVDAVRLAWQVNGVREVINEIKVSESGGISSFARDNWITAQLRARMIFDGTIVSINYSIDTVDGVIYLMGIAQNQEELDKVINIARNIAYVTNVVSYVRVKG